MRDLVRRVISGFKSVQLQGQDEGYVLFVGREPDTQEKVTIKILPRVMDSNPDAEKAFESTARAIRQLNHPNIVPIRQVGHESGLPYLVTRAIETGQSLTDRLQKGWTVEEAADAAMQLAQALEHAHNKGIVHGALTPEDVVVQGDGRLLVTDIGMADLRRLVGAAVKQVASPFIAPEVQQGVRGDARADVYSLAAMLYQMLAARPPQMVKGEVMPAARFRADVPPEMDQVLARALAADPSKRYPDVRSFIAALGAIKVGPAVRQPAPAAAATIRCPKCGAENQSARFCRKCGTALVPAQAAAAAAQAQPKRPAAQAQPKPVPGKPQPKPVAGKPQSKPAAGGPPQRVRDKKEEPAPPQRSILDEPIQITRIEVGSVQVGGGVEVHDTVIARPIQVASDKLDIEFPAPLEMPRLNLEELWPTSGEVTITMPAPPPIPEIDWATVAPPMPEVPTIEDIPIEETRRREAELLALEQQAAALAREVAAREGKAEA